MTKLSLRPIVLLVQVFVASLCSLSYELLIGTAVSNITGNSVLSFSLAIGFFLAGLGLGAFISQWLVTDYLATNFVVVEMALALVGGFAVLLLYMSFIFTPYFTVVQIILTLGVGLLSGLEIPILTRLLKSEPNSQLKTVLANVLSFDYLGGLAASVLFPLLLLPYFGLVRLNFIIGLLNILTAVLAALVFWNKLAKTKILVLTVLSLVSGLLILGIIYSSSVYNFVESYLYRDSIIYSTQSKYQRIVFTQSGKDLRLYLNGGIQFSALDEYRYHESLVIPAMLYVLSQKPDTPLKIAVLGGGDGLAVRELLKFRKHIDQIKLVEIDPVMVDLAKNLLPLKELNQESLTQPEVDVIVEDAWLWVQRQPKQYFDLIITDFPDPDEVSLAKLYSLEFFKLINQLLTETGALVLQSTSPYATPTAFWCVYKTLTRAFPEVYPYNVYIPSFGLWGFQLAIKQPGSFAIENLATSSGLLRDNHYVNSQTISAMFQLEPDILEPRLKDGQKINKELIQINTLDNLIVSYYYLQLKTAE